MRGWPCTPCLSNDIVVWYPLFGKQMLHCLMQKRCANWRSSEDARQSRVREALMRSGSSAS
jgi:hypothetical protein